MAWFLNHYICARCYRRWSNDWSCMCDDDCPHCGARHTSPDKSDDLTSIIMRENDAFAVLVSPAEAEHDPAYQRIARFPTYAEAEAFQDSTRDPS